MKFYADNYELLEKIGEGGFGEVYKARQINTNQLVAIKFLTIQSALDAETEKRYIDRFEREMLLGSRLQHPHIVRLLDKGRNTANQLYAVFEYVQGKTLREILLSDGALSPILAAEIMAQVLDALAHAHQRGVIHRDIKPANIMLTNTGAKTHAMVLDFGIGALVNEVRQLDYKSLTLTRETLGTPSYSAPEQLRGEPPTPKTDLYVWGLLFIECLTGQPTISGSSLASIFHQQLSPSNVPIPTAIAGHPVAGLLRRVLNKKAGERASSAAAVYRSLMQINFASLVGEIGGQKTPAVANQYSPTDTLLISSEIYRSKLTERKQITVLSVLLGIRSDDDDTLNLELVDTLFNDQKSQCQDIAIRYGAFHVGSLGDSLLFYFGYPTVSENDTRLCARAALDIVGGIKQRNALIRTDHGMEFSVRMGMHTGLVTCYADAVPEGSTPNRALALSRMAEMNQILCSEGTRKLLDSYLDFTPVKDQTTDVNGATLARYRLIGERQLEAFGFLRGTQKNHAFIGRNNELVALKALLQTSAQSNENSQPKLAHVSGEAGIGKSRLVFELRNAASNMSHYVAQCLPEHQNNALYPIINILKYQYSLDSLNATDAAERLREAIDQQRWLDDSNNVDNENRLSILCNWLDLPLPDNVSPSTLPPDQQKHILFSTLNALIAQESAEPTGALNESENSPRKLIIFEDMHWADPTSLDFIAQFVGSPAFTQAGHAFISTSRQPLPESCNPQAFTLYELAKLTPEATGEFISALFDNAKVSARVLDVLITRTDGIPLFIEELVNMLKQKELVKTFAEGIDFVSDDKLQEVPSSLRDSLQQKLDSLVYSKSTAQLAATIGREFDYDLLMAASNLNEGQIQNNLNELIEAELVYRQRKVGGDSYIFKHALVRDAAYESLSAQVVKFSHQRIAESMLKRFPERAEAEPALVAAHFAGAELFQSATEFGLKQAKQQVKMSSNLEAIQSTTRNIEWAQKVDNPIKRVEQTLSTYEVLLPAMMTTKGYGAEELISVIRNIHDHVDEWNAQGESSEVERWKDLVDRSRWVQFLNFHYRSERIKARELGESLLAEARANGDKRRAMAILSHLAQARQMDGDFRTALGEFNESIRLFDEINDPSVALEYGLHVKAQSMAMSSFCYYYSGQVNKGLDIIIESIRISEELNHDSSIVFAYLFACLYCSYMGDDEKVVEYATRYYQRHGKTRSEVWHTIFIDTLYSCANKDLPAAEKYFEEMLASGQDFASGHYAPFIAKLYNEAGQFDKSIALIELTLNRVMAVGLKSAYAPLNNLLAKCFYLKSGDYAPKVASYFQSAIDHAKDQGAIYLELESLCDSYLLAGSPENASVTDRIQELMREASIEESSSAYKKAREIILC